MCLFLRNSLSPPVCIVLLLFTDSLCTFSGGSPEEQVCIWFWHHQHADGVWQSRAKNEGVNSCDRGFLFLLMPSSSSSSLCFFSCGQELIERLDSLLCGDGSESLKSLCLKLLLCLVTVRLNMWPYRIIASVLVFNFLLLDASYYEMSTLIIPAFAFLQLEID